MPTDDVRLTDEYSDYNIARRMVGVAGVLGFGAAAGVGLMKLNNSAVMRSLGKNFESKSWRYNTGSILFSGTAVNTSQLLRQSVEDTANLGVSRTKIKQWEHSRQAQYVSRKNGFLDNIVRKYEELNSKKQIERTVRAESALKDLSQMDDLSMRLANKDLTDFFRTDIQTFLLSEQDGILTSRGFGRYSLANKGLLTKMISRSVRGVERGIEQRYKSLAKPLSQLGKLTGYFDEMQRRRGYKTKERIVKGLKSLREHGFSSGKSLGALEVDDLKQSIDNFIEVLNQREGAETFQSRALDRAAVLYDDIQSKKSKRVKLIDLKNKKFAMHDLMDLKNHVEISRELGIDFSKDPSKWKIGSTSRIFIDNNKMRKIVSNLSTATGAFEDSRYIVTDLIEQMKGVTTEGMASGKQLSRYQTEAMYNATEIFEEYIKGDAKLLDMLEHVDNARNALSSDWRIRAQLSRFEDTLSRDQTLWDVVTDLEATTRGTAYHKDLTTYLADKRAKVGVLNMTRNEQLSYISDTLDRYLHDRIQESERFAGGAHRVADHDRIMKRWDKFNKRLYALKTNSELMRPVKSRLRETLVHGKMYLSEIAANKQRLFMPKRVRGTRGTLKFTDWVEVPRNIREGEMFREIVGQAQETGRLMGSAGSDFVIENYRRATERGFGGGKPGLFNYLLGSDNPLYQFEETLVGKNGRLKKLQAALRESLGADDVKTAVRTIEDGTKLQIRLLPTVADATTSAAKMVPLDIEIPVTVGNIMFKNQRAYALPGLAEQTKSKVLRGRSAVTYFFDKIIDRVDQYKNLGIRSSIDDVQFTSAIDDLTKKIKGYSGMVFGTAGTPGLGLDITDMSHSEAMKLSGQYQSMKLHFQTSSMYRRSLKRNIRYKQAEYYVRQQTGVATTDELWRIHSDIGRLETKLRNLGRSPFKAASKLIEDLSEINVIHMNDMSFTVNDVVRNTNALLFPNITGVAAVNISKGKFNMLEGVRMHTLPDSARNMKAFLSLSDPLNIVSTKFMLEHKGYDMTGGLTFRDKYTMKGLLDLGINTKRSPIYRKFQQFKVDAKGKIDDLQKVLKNLNRMGSDEVIKLVKNDQLKATIGDILNAPNKTYRLKRLLTKSQLQLDLTDKVYKAIDHPDMIDPLVARMESKIIPDKERLNKLSKRIFGHDIDTIVGRTKHPRPSTAYLTADSTAWLQELGYIHSGAGGELISRGAGSSINQLRVFQIDYPMGAEGVTYLSETGAKKLGYLIDRSESNMLSMEDFQSAVKKAAARGDISPRSAKKVVSVLTNKLQGDKPIAIEAIRDALGSTKEFEDFYRSVNKVINSTDPSVKLLKKAGLQQKLIEEGSAAVQLSHIAFDGKSIRVKYDYIHSVISGSKLIAEDTNKYVVNMILRDEQFLGMQRGLTALQLGEQYANKDPRVRQFIEWFQKENRTIMKSNEWDDFVKLFKGKNNTPIRNVLKGMSVYDMFGTTKRTSGQGLAPTSAGVLRNIFEDLLDLRLNDKSPVMRERVFRSTKMREIYEGIFSDILKTFTRDDVRTGGGAIKMNRYAGKKLAGGVSLLRDPIFRTVHVNTPEQSLQQLYLTIKKVEGSSTEAINSAVMRTNIDSMISKRLNDVKDSKIITNVEKSMLRSKMMAKINRLLTIADKKAHPAIPFVETIMNIGVTTQNAFELSGVTERGKYSRIRGFEKGAKLSLYDAMMIKMMGMPYTGQKIIEHMKHGRRYIQTYMGTLMEMMDMDPNKYWDARINTRSNKIKTGLMQSDVAVDILKFKSEYKNNNYGYLTELKRDPTIGGLLELEPEESRLLEKGIFPERFKETLDNQLDDIAKARSHDMDRTIEQAVRYKTEKVYQEIKIKEFANLSDKDQIRALRASSTRMLFDDVQEYAKFLRKHKAVAFGVDPNAPKYTLKMNALGSRQINAMSLHTFGFDELDYSLKQINSLSEGKMMKTSDNIFTFMEGTVNKNPNTNMVVLNDALRTQLAFTKAVHMGASEYVLNVLGNERADALASYTRKIVSDNLKRGLPATVSGIGVGAMSVRYDRMNVWSVVKEVSEQFRGTIGNSRDLIRASRRDLTNVFKTFTNKVKGGKVRIDGNDISMESVQNVIKKFLYDTSDGKPGRIFTANPGETVMSMEHFTKALSTVTSSTRKAEEIAGEVITGKRNWMSFGLRYPTLRETNTMPMVTNLFDHQTLKDLGMATLHDELGSTKLGVKKDTFMINMMDAGLFGGDFDRDMYLSVLAVDDKFDIYQRELKEKFANDMSFTYEYKDHHGEKYAIVTKKTSGKRARHTLDAISKDINSEYDELMRRHPGMQKNNAILQAMEKDGVDITYMGDEGKYYFRGRSTNIIRDAVTMENFQQGKFSKKAPSRNKGRSVFLLNSNDNIEFTNRMREAMMDKTVTGQFSPEEVSKMLKGRYKGDMNALLQDQTYAMKKRIESMQRTLTGEGWSVAEIGDLMDRAKQATAEMKDSMVEKYMSKTSPTSTFKNLFEATYRRRLPEITGSLMAIKTLTGEVHNVGKYLIGDLAMTIFGKSDPKKALRIASWAGDLSDANILGKHKIPVITEDVIKTIKTMVDPNVDDFQLAEATFKLRRGEFDILASRQEKLEVFRTSRYLRKHAQEINNPIAQRAAQKIRGLSKEFEFNTGPYGSITNLQYMKFLKQKQMLSHDRLFSDAMGLMGDEMRSIKQGIKGIEKGVNMVKEFGEGLLEARPRLLSAMEITGAKTMRDMMAIQTYMSNYNAAPSKIAHDLRTMISSPLSLETATREILFSKFTDKLKKGGAPSIFNEVPVSATLSKRGSEKLAKFLQNKNLANKIDIESFRGVGIGAMVGMAAIGFIGAFAVQRNRRDWLGPSSGTGGEYWERRGRKDEEALTNKTTAEMLKDRNIPMGALHFQKPRDARIIPTGIHRSRGDTLAEQLRSIYSANMIAEPRSYSRLGIA